MMTKIYLALLILALAACGVKKAPEPAFTTHQPFEIHLESSTEPSPTPTSQEKK